VTCGRKLKRLLLTLVFLSLPLSGFLSAEAVYEITESELTELETTLTRQADTIETQRATLTELQRTINEQRGALVQLSTTIETQETTINALRTSFGAYETEARRATFRSVVVAAAAGILIGGVVGVAAF